MAVFAYCLIPNPVHVIPVSDRKGGARVRPRREAPGVVRRQINAQLRVAGHLFLARFGSITKDEGRLMTAARTVALNPVRARLPQTSGRLALIERRRASGQARRRPRERPAAPRLRRSRSQSASVARGHCPAHAACASDHDPGHEFSRQGASRRQSARGRRCVLTPAGQKCGAVDELANLACHSRPRLQSLPRTPRPPDTPAPRPYLMQSEVAKAHAKPVALALTAVSRFTDPRLKPAAQRRVRLVTQPEPGKLDHGLNVRTSLFGCAPGAPTRRHATTVS